MAQTLEKIFLQKVSQMPKEEVIATLPKDEPEKEGLLVFQRRVFKYIYVVIHSFIYLFVVSFIAEPVKQRPVVSEIALQEATVLSNGVHLNTPTRLCAQTDSTLNVSIKAF